MGNKKKLSLSQKQNISGWIFLTPATLLIAIMSFYPMIRAIILSMQSGVGARIIFSGLTNYKRMFSDAIFMQSLKNTFIYLIVQVPIMLQNLYFPAMCHFSCIICNHIQIFICGGRLYKYRFGKLGYFKDRL